MCLRCPRLPGELPGTGRELRGGGEDAAKPQPHHLACPHGLRIGIEIGQRPREVGLTGGVKQRHHQPDVHAAFRY